MNRDKEITLSDYKDITEWELLNDKMNTVYSYRYSVATYYDTTEWKECTDKLWIIIEKQREGWVENVELLEKVS